MEQAEFAVAIHHGKDVPFIAVAWRPDLFDEVTGPNYPGPWGERQQLPRPGACGAPCRNLALKAAPHKGGAVGLHRWPVVAPRQEVMQLVAPYVVVTKMLLLHEEDL